jgi:hypothetical protein
MATEPTTRDTPLHAAIEDNCLVIRIGIGMLANGAERIQELFDHEESLTVRDDMQFAKDVARAMEEEDEAGNSMLTKMLDEASVKAWEDGSEGCDLQG